MDTQSIVEHLKEERSRIEHAIAALEGTHSHSAVATKHGPAKKKPGGISAAGRKKLSEMMKRRWAERRKQAAKKVK